MTGDGDLDAFERVVRGRRSVRVFGPEPVPDAALARCFALAVLAPSAHNLHPWELIHVRDPGVREALRAACLDQQAAHAPTLVVAAARPDRWREHCAWNRAAAEQRGEPDLVRKYGVVVPALFEEGPLHVLAPVKAAVAAVVGWFRPTVRGPFGAAAQRAWATKSTALACQTFLLALRASGFDGCAMEGFDAARVRRLVGLPRAASVVMVIGAGTRAEGGVSPQVRFGVERFVRAV